MSIIEINGLTKDYGNHKGVFDLTFTVNEGEVFGYLGPNGAGKTTTIRHLMGFLTPDKGYASILGKECRTNTADIMKDLGYLPAEIAFFDGMNGADFLKFMGEMRGKIDLSYRDQLIDRFELDAKGRIRKMSKGMKQKLGIICAFMHNPKVLILDEPTSGLDPLMQKIFADLILEEKAKGKTILMSSHSFEEIERTCDRIGIIRQGELVATEDIHNLKEKRRRTYLITFDSPSSAAAFAEKNHFESISVNGSIVKVSVLGNVSSLVQELGKYTILDLSVENSTLEDVFMQYYGNSSKSKV
ncbi:ABC transporter ATP-binding protein [Lachnospiraceae bacterium MD1]|jgi:ABC-2 type transport system ATP-binding protein|uniref:ABC transporter ATP-binding protein n=1 Tax=Variimorphobacter saccharofermentans TaxID=2755051 RepID=A0A839JZJ3_9FIRM|nr:ABC transporter ATP-binding protein [Variimorphobacter saccharofermentans]MBB2182079.1 ABC transporter ATP-binding protein [Variimorphobacter saccharofermentans]